MILGGENVARSPADFRAQGLKRFDQDGCLDGHVERAGDARPLERLTRGVFLTNGHEARHLGFSNDHLATTPGGQRDVSNEIVFKSSSMLSNDGHVHSLLKQ